MAAVWAGDIAPPTPAMLRLKSDIVEAPFGPRASRKSPRRLDRSATLTANLAPHKAARHLSHWNGGKMPVSRAPNIMKTLEISQYCRRLSARSREGGDHAAHQRGQDADGKCRRSR